MDTDPERAAAIANTLVTVFAEQNLADQASRYETSKQNIQTQIDQMDQQIQNATTELNNLADDPANQAKIDQLNLALSQYRQTYAYLIQSYEEIRLAETQSISNIVQKEPAIPPGGPIRPQTMRDTILAAFVGLDVGHWDRHSDRSLGRHDQRTGGDHPRVGIACAGFHRCPWDRGEEVDHHFRATLTRF